MTASGRLFTWGFGEMLQLGNAQEKDEPTPYEVPKSSAMPRAVRVSAGGQHVVLVAAP